MSALPLELVVLVKCAAHWVLTAVPLLKRLRAGMPWAPVYLSVTTLAGRAMAGEKLAGLAAGVFYAPFDLTFALRAVLRRHWLHAVRTAGFTTTDGSLGIATTGALNEASLRAMLKRMPHGTWELVCHPGYNDSDLAALRTKLRASRELDMAALLKITAHELRDDYGVELAPFRAELPKSATAGKI